ncbi:hypothetical protein L6452_01389 [Arctium lappa]|uniref:Uncharacterized protein n=1 Tax=Arctium lappa TaxID=4217 RepID=A0ACB9FI02_ARCLA|nr:hypothetical protein L6452_01389 [Arctium lappa]
MVGSLQYLTITRLDIAFAVNSISQYMCQHRTTHLIAAKQVLRYVKRTLDYGLKFLAQQPLVHVSSYSNADWASSSESRRSSQAISFTLVVTLCLGAPKSNLPLHAQVPSQNTWHWLMLAQKPPS